MSGPVPDTAPLRLWALEPSDMTCRHARAGVRHRSLRAIWRCLVETGTPPMRAVPMEVGP